MLTDTTGVGNPENDVERPLQTGESRTSISNYSCSNDAATWPIPLLDNIRLPIILKGSEIFQNKDGPFLAAERIGESIKGTHRSLTTSWFYTSSSDETKVLRKWMIYSTSSNKLYCFCCRIFATHSDLHRTFVSGFDQWWKLNPKIAQHESCNEHLSNFEKWKTLFVRLQSEKTIDHVTQKEMNVETKKWRDILHRLLQTTLFLAKQNLAFRGHREDFESENRGNFLELIKLMAAYDPVLREHWSKLEKYAGGSERLPSYLSKGIQNEFICILGDHVLENIISDVKKAKYYGLLLDSTPDNSHIDQMCKIVRYVHIEERVVEVRESFLGFFPMNGKTAADITEDTLKELKKDKLDIQLCTSQGYDNAFTMSGRHKGVQTRIRDQNPKAIFNPCSNHSLNLCGIHSFGCVTSSVTFFGTLEKIYAFFAASTHRWEILLKNIDTTLKRLTDTRWSAHHKSVKAARNNIVNLIETIETIRDSPDENLNSKSAAGTLLPPMCNFTFLSFLEFWFIILTEVDSAQIYLQKKGITLDRTLKKMEALLLFLVEERNDIVSKAIDFGTKKSQEFDIEIENRQRVRKRKLLPGELATDSNLTVLEENQRSMYECLDRFVQELQERLGAMRKISNTFQVVQSNFLMNALETDISSAVRELNLVYHDFDEEEISQEVKRLRRHIRATNTTIEAANSWTTKEILQFIITWDFNESLPNLCLILKYFLTICVSVASCERSFSKLKLIKNYLRSTMSEQRLNSLAILSIERQIASTIDFDEVIDKFASIKARKHKL